LKIHVTWKVAELVFILDELGSADWEDRKAKKVIAAAGVASEDVYKPVSRRHRHVALLSCVSAAGDALTPLVITASPIPDTLWRRDLKHDEDAMIRQRSLAYLSEELFYDYISIVFVSSIMAVRDWTGFQNETAVLLMDPAIPHTSERVRGIFSENHIMAMNFPAHMTSSFQALDLVFFGALKN
jgi:hypothetical protein